MPDRPRPNYSPSVIRMIVLPSAEFPYPPGVAGSFKDVRLLGPPTVDGEYVALGDQDIVHLHDYARIYAVPGLYEHVVQELLQCRSPQAAADGFLRTVARLGLEAGSMTVLDVGAGTGLVGELLRCGGVGRMVGVDALPVGRTACRRDRPGVYDGYVVGDLASGDSELCTALHEYAFEGLVSAGAFGGTHAPPVALVNALALLPAGAPVVLTIDERWIEGSDRDGFGLAVERLVDRGDLKVIERTRFRHRITTTGEPVLYELISGMTG
jgi:predicted TPR repeat methyltransferase